MDRSWKIASAFVLSLATLPAQAIDASKQLDEILVEETIRGDFAEADAWDREVRDALQRATLKQRSELTAHDHQQILILQHDMPVLKRALDDMRRLLRAHKFRRTLTTRETVQLSQAYQQAEAILENIPDAYMPSCKMVHQFAHRNEVSSCTVDYLEIERLVDELRRKKGPQTTALANNASRDPATPTAQIATPIIRVAHPQKPRGPQRVHVQADYFRLQQVRVAHLGDTMILREDFHAIATELPDLVPPYSLRLQLATGTAMTLNQQDRLKVLGHVKVNGEILRVVSLPRAAAIGYGMIVRADGGIHGGLVAFDASWSGRSRMIPIEGQNVTALPADVRLLAQYAVEQVLDEEPFVRYEIAFAGATGHTLTLELRRYSAPGSVRPAASERFEFPAAIGVVEIGGLTVDVREIEPKRIKFAVQRAAPATLALTAATAAL